MLPIQLPPELHDLPQETLKAILVQRAEQYRHEAAQWYIHAETLRRLPIKRSQQTLHQREVDQATAQAQRALEGLRITNEMLDDLAGDEPEPQHVLPPELTLENMDESITLAELQRLHRTHLDNMDREITPTELQRLNGS